jgi:mxaK protein
MKRLVFILLTGALLCSATVLVFLGFAVWGDWRDNSDIRTMAAGRNADLRRNADTRAIHGRILFLARRDRLLEAQDVLPLMIGAPQAQLAEVQFVIGNARMRAAFELMQTSKLNEAIPEVNLAKAAYREALRADPAYRDAKVNLDLAMRLVRDLPRPEAEGESDPENRPRRLWTDLPGMPRGAP